MDNLYRFVALEFVDDPNVVGYKYWYLCNIGEVKAGDKALAPLGRHNRLQEGVVREVRITDGENAPYPLPFIKSVVKLVNS